MNEWCDNTKGVIRIRKPKKDRQRHTKHNTENPLNTGGELRYSGNVSSSCSTHCTRLVTGKRHEHHLILEIIRPCHT
jgi:hypothetical protein